jgi:hypothetical protein
LLLRSTTTSLPRSRSCCTPSPSTATMCRVLAGVVRLLRNRTSLRVTRESSVQSTYDQTRSARQIA